MNFDNDNEDHRRALALFRKQQLEDLIESDLPRGEIAGIIEALRLNRE